MYNERKAAQVAAFFTAKQGGTISHLKLMKLMYLAERSSIQEYGDSMLDDALVSMRYGPVLSRTKDCMDGYGDTELQDGWDSWISDHANHKVSLTKEDFSEELLDEISPSEIELMERVWAVHGSKDQWDLADYTHKSCAEWRDPGTSTLPIDYGDVLVANGTPDDVATELSGRIKERQRLEKLLHAL
ncbi:putative phage-associated protein [Janthinobacterium sp. CG_23.3]|uniref:Panacea domain-containing protein n=1 Tax=Janthinobacterium sp. CG_23.3 TaxID=3349634 RepID=UPI0038D5130F